ncbi:DUF554 domain-containing protein [Oceanobacillus sp. CAU 1775]
MVLLGTIINSALIIVGTLIGLFFNRIPDKYKETVMHGIGLAVTLIGIQMALVTENIVMVLISLLVGAIIGEFLKIEDALNNLGLWLGSKFRTKDETVSISQGFITATMLFCIGAMAIIGALDSGIRGDHSVLVTKGIIDGFSALVLTTTLGIGVIFSVVPLFLYQGGITLFATQIEKWVPEAMLNGLIQEVTAVGGLLIVAIGLNLLNFTKIRIANLMPAIFAVAGIYFIYQLF